LTAAALGVFGCAFAFGANVANAPEDGTAAPPARGFAYFNDRDRSVPWSIHVLKIDRSHPGLGFGTTLGGTGTIGMDFVSEQVKRLPAEAGRPIAAVNGDFYDDREPHRGRPQNVQIHLGELISSPGGQSAFWIDTAGQPHMTNVESRLHVFWPDRTATPLSLNAACAPEAAVLYTARVGKSTLTKGGADFILERGPDSPWLPLEAGKTYRARIREARPRGDAPLDHETMVLSLGRKLTGRATSLVVGDTLEIVTETVPDLSGVSVAIGGGPALVRNGQTMEWSGLQIRHPRTAIGWNADWFYMVAVDGRQLDLSVGMSLPELATYMAKLGCDHAMNLDGGGSATFWILGSVINSPSEGQERPSANALVLVENPVGTE
jgi:hypothetical protein